jgi:ATP-binding cassette subfamily C (CFTR/MRP) protein 1
VLSLSILILVCKDSHLPRTSSIATSSLTMVACLIISVLSWMEHERSLRSSFLLNGYLSITILFDIAQCRTLFLRGDASSIKRLFTVALGVKAIVLLLEAQSKSNSYLTAAQGRSDEETSGLFSLCTYSWLTALIAQGHRKILVIEDLPVLDKSLSAQHQLPRFETAWSRSPRHGRARLLSALAISAGPRGLYPILPRVAHIGFAFCQPFLIQGVSQYLQNPSDSTSVNHGYGWIGATFLAYSGMAVTSSLYWYYHQRVLARLRADLVASVFRQTTCLSHSHGEKSITLTLMSTDVERIQRGMHDVHEVWANTIQVGLAAWLLQRQIGIAFLVPLAYVALCVVMSLTFGKFSVQRQGEWMRATQKRVGSLSKIIIGMKSSRMMGLSTQLTDTVEQQRNAELHSANRYRLILVFSAVVGFSPLLLSPVLTFSATGRTLDTSKIFTSLAFLLLVCNPLAQLLQIIPQLIATLACFDRVAEFLEIMPHKDERDFAPTSGLEKSALFVESRTSNSKECMKQEATECEYTFFKRGLFDLCCCVFVDTTEYSC